MTENLNPNIVGQDRLPSRGGMRYGKLRLNNAFDLTSMQKMPSTTFNSSATNHMSEDVEGNPEAETYHRKRNKSSNA
jgi:hypothetical protein